MYKNIMIVEHSFDTSVDVVQNTLSIGDAVLIRETPFTYSDLTEWGEALGIPVTLQDILAKHKEGDHVYTTGWDEEYKCVNTLSNDPKLGILGNHKLEWHQDRINMPSRTGLIMLHAEVTPESGGETSLISLFDMYNYMIEDGWEVDYITSSIRSHNSDSYDDYMTKAPVVIEYQGRKLLRVGNSWHNKNNEFVNRFWELAAELEKRGEIMSHPWKVGDTLIINNQLNIHTRNAFIGDRILRRVAITTNPI